MLQRYLHAVCLCVVCMSVVVCVFEYYVNVLHVCVCVGFHMSTVIYPQTV